jgi:hypothetical protein
MPNLMHGNRQQGWVREGYSGVGPERQQDGRLANSTGLIPGQVGLTGPIKVEVVDPVHHDLRRERVGRGSKEHPGSSTFPCVEGFPHIPQQTRVVPRRPAFHDCHL